MSLTEFWCVHIRIFCNSYARLTRWKIYRCFLIWDRNRYIVIVPGLMLFLTTGILYFCSRHWQAVLTSAAVLSYISAYEGDYPSAGGPAIDLRIGFALGVLTNIVLVGLTGARPSVISPVFSDRSCLAHSRPHMAHPIQGARAPEERCCAPVQHRHGDDVSPLPFALIPLLTTLARVSLESGAIVCAWTVVYVILRSVSPPVRRLLFVLWRPLDFLSSFNRRSGGYSAVVSHRFWYVDAPPHSFAIIHFGIHSRILPRH